MGVHLAPNGVTVVADEGSMPGDTGVLNGITYTIVDNDMLSAKSFNDTDWSRQCTTLVTDMTGLFLGSWLQNWNQDIGSWDVSNVTSMFATFFNARTFNKDISHWDVSNVTTTRNMFRSAWSFQKDISSWNMSSVTDASSMFEDTRNTITTPWGIGSWDVSNIENMEGMFFNANNFNENISGWDVSSVTNMSRMFDHAGQFQVGLNNWDVSNVTTMNSMFDRAVNFTGDISAWDTSSVTNMEGMFRDAWAFSIDISSWDVSNVENMKEMFQRTRFFNRGITAWDTSSVVNMDGMFNESERYNQDLKGWCVRLIDEQPIDFATDSILSSSNFPIWGFCPSDPGRQEVTTITDGVTTSENSLEGTIIKEIRLEDTDLIIRSITSEEPGITSLYAYLTTDLAAGRSMSAIVSGGVAPYTVTWNYPDGTRIQGTSSNGSSIKFDSSQSGSVTATIEDNVGNTITTTPLQLD